MIVLHTKSSSTRSMRSQAICASPPVFGDFVTDEQNKRLLLDHILLSPRLTRPGGLRKVDGSGTVHHAEFDAQVVNGGAQREDRPSDHRPVSVELEY